MCKLSNIKRFMHSDFTEKDKINELNLAFDKICKVLISSDISYKLKDKNTLQPSDFIFAGMRSRVFIISRGYLTLF